MQEVFAMKLDSVGSPFCYRVASAAVATDGQNPSKLSHFQIRDCGFKL